MNTKVETMAKKESAFLKRLRAVCLALPEAEETVTWGHPTFRAGRKTFAVYETYKGIPSLAIYAGPAAQPALLDDPRFYKTPYIGHKGWVSLDTRHPVRWAEVRALVEQSYLGVVPPRLRRTLST